MFRGIICHYAHSGADTVGVGERLADGTVATTPTLVCPTCGRRLPPGSMWRDLGGQDRD